MTTYKTSDIISIGELNAINGKNLAVCLAHSNYKNNGVPNYFVNVTNEEFKKTEGNKEKMKELAILKLGERLKSNSDLSGIGCNIWI
jgi:hypothetical protein